jgi:hypothetical protein
MRNPKCPSGLSVLVLTLLFGCSGRHATKDDAESTEPIQECNAFLSAYEQCLETLGPARIAQARVEQTRAGLVAQVQTAHGDTARAALRKQCTDNLSQLKATCH